MLVQRLRGPPCRRLGARLCMVAGGLRTVVAVGVLLLALTAALLLPRNRLDLIPVQSRPESIVRSSLDRTSSNWQCARERLAWWWTPHTPTNEASRPNENTTLQPSQNMPPTACSCKASPPGTVFANLLAQIHGGQCQAALGHVNLAMYPFAGSQQRRGGMSIVRSCSRLL